MQGLLKDSSTQQGFIEGSILSCVSLGPGFLSSDTSEVCNKDACPAPCNVLPILPSQLRESVGLTRNDAIKRELLLREQNNRGSATWQLVKAVDGWRIAFIIYSSEPPVQ